MSELRIERRFNGPPDSGNGGYVCGCLATSFPDGAEVTLRRPPPLSRALSVENLEREGVRSAHLHDGATLVAEARAAQLALELPPIPSLAEAERAARDYAGFASHVFPHCFVCGPERAPGDGLRIFAGPVAPGRVAAPWLPDDSLADADGRVRDEFQWAALDCPGVFAFGPLEVPTLLGRLTARIHARPRVGEPCVVVGWSLGREGRKLFSATAIFDPSGRLTGAARAVWIQSTERPPG